MRIVLLVLFASGFCKFRLVAGLFCMRGFNLMLRMIEFFCWVKITLTFRSRHVLQYFLAIIINYVQLKCFLISDFRLWNRLLSGGEKSVSLQPHYGGYRERQDNEE